jgi:hypothetical protein
MKWKIEYNDGKVEYHHPAEVQLVLTDCLMKNNRTAAQKIFTGESTKVVCAYVLCKGVEILTEDFIPETTAHLKYNPRVLPFWNLNGMNVDGTECYIFVLLIHTIKFYYYGIRHVSLEKNLCETMVT